MKFTVAFDAYGQQYIYRNGSMINLTAYKTTKAVERYIKKCAGASAYTIEYKNR